jgi:hypothetical protein
MARYRILSWRGIPAQLKIFPEQGRPKAVALDGWFVKEIDRVAMREGLIGTDVYLEQFKWSSDLERPGSAEDVAIQIVAELEATWVPRSRES